MITFGERLKELRERDGLTQKQLAAETDFSQGMIARWEHGVHEPTASAIIKLAHFFDVTTDYLLGVVD